MSAPTLVIDPGHGGEHPEGRSTPIDAVGPSGSREKDVTLALGRSLATRFGADAVLTRNGDVNLPLCQRCAVARRASAPVFVSLHANAGGHGRGSEVYVHRDGTPASIMLASAIGRELETFGSARRGVIDVDNLAVLSPQHHASSTAACLIEADYLSYREGEARLRDPRALDELAGAIATGVRAFQAQQRFGKGPDPSCSTADHTLPYRFSFAISNQIYSYSFYSTGVINLEITVRLTGGFSPRPVSGPWPPTLSIMLKQCTSGLLGRDATTIDTGSTIADGVSRSFTFNVDPGVYYFHFRLASSWNVQGTGTIS